jgi:hypothetical protein
LLVTEPTGLGMGDPEIRHHDTEGLVGLDQDDVGRLQITMNNPLSMDRFESSTNLTQQTQRFGGRHGRLSELPLCKCLPIEKLHGQEWSGIAPEELEDPRHARMGHSAGNEDLAAKLLERIGSIGADIFQDLHGHGGLKEQVPSFVDRPHASPSNQPDELEAVDQHFTGQISTRFDGCVLESVS